MRNRNRTNPTRGEKNAAGTRMRTQDAIAVLSAFIALLSIAACSDQPAQKTPATPTFSEHIAPIIFANCVPCHRPEGSGPFPFTSYDEVNDHAGQIAEVTASRFMPPWQPSPGYGHFVGERLLTDAQIDLIARWVESGAPAGDPRQMPPLPEFSDEWQLGTPDLIVEMDEPYLLPAEGYDEFRNFVLPIPVAAQHYVEAVEFHADNVQVIHHAVMMFDRSGTARKHDAREDGPGFDGMVFGEAQGPDGHFLGWTPGKQPYRDPELAWRLVPGTDLVLQLHMLPSGRPEPLRARIGFYFAAGPPKRTPALVRLGRKDIDIPAGEAQYPIRDTYQLPVDIEVTSIYPHAHYLGKSMAVYALLPDGKKEWLIRIDEWDFNWQDEKPVELPKGSTLVMEYVYDNSADNPFNPHDPPQRIFYGLQSSDEMADLTLQVVPQNPRDLKTLQQHYARKWIAQEIAGYETMLIADPDHAGNHHTLAMCYLRTGRGREALEHFNECLRLEPDYAEARVNLGIALSASRQFAAAIEHFRRALESKPTYSDAHFNLAMALFQSGEKKEAEKHFAEAARLRPEMAAAIQRHVARLQGR
jgi:mono/diheme cytochrome c family protein/TPR repeat protein